MAKDGDVTLFISHQGQQDFVPGRERLFFVAGYCQESGFLVVTFLAISQRFPVPTEPVSRISGRRALLMESHQRRAQTPLL